MRGSARSFGPSSFYRIAMLVISNCVGTCNFEGLNSLNAWRSGASNRRRGPLLEGKGFENMFMKNTEEAAVRIQE